MKAKGPFIHRNPTLEFHLCCNSHFRTYRLLLDPALLLLPPEVSRHVHVSTDLDIRDTRLVHYRADSHLAAFIIRFEAHAARLEWERLLEAAVEDALRVRGAAELASRLPSLVTFPRGDLVFVAGTVCVYHG